MFIHSVKRLAFRHLYINSLIYELLILICKLNWIDTYVTTRSNLPLVKNRAFIPGVYQDVPAFSGSLAGFTAVSESCGGAKPPSRHLSAQTSVVKSSADWLLHARDTKTAEKNALSCQELNKRTVSNKPAAAFLLLSDSVQERKEMMRNL